ncbi:peptidoglycan D,D-transpeptidase FtsI family protein [Yinghuangia seranimata]|uniref:peptidoglycan D,D-transpeptidase FtsI family protein n=1 Tax=Yinghuangia seranimata TaxID=408067 RepID=UPI00248B7E04|nr:penicillin-binding protein 2 [Yinghuangia seranimata]MDI2132850.1 penicillin-binding protein 2 [Yinghuangia seranimata]
MNKPLRKVSIFCLVLIAALMVRANWVQVVKADDYANNSHNKRAVYADYSHPRGDFLVENRPITGSIETDSKKYEYQRTYTDGAMYAPVTGYKSQFFGASLLESIDDSILSGDDNRLFVRRVIDVITGKERRGGNVALTLNSKAQQAAFQQLTSQNKTGAVVAIDPATGKILTMVSTPSFDPNKLSVNDSKAQDQAWKALNGDPTKPMDNRAIRTTYAPGSTFKLVTAAAALASGKYSPDAATQFDSPMRYPSSTKELTDSAGAERCKNATLKVALELSCNTVFAGIGADLGDDAVKKQAEAFGFNDFGAYDFQKPAEDTKNNLDVPSRVTASKFPSNKTDVGATMRASIGQQSVAATPMQMAMVASAIANNGKLMQPYLVDSLKAQNLETIEQTQPKELKQPVTPEVAGQLRDMMKGVVEEGTCKTAQIPGVEVGGKTGTAQRGVNNSDRPYAWFVSYAKAGDKMVAVAVVIEDQDADVERNDISGCKSAAPTAVAVMRAVLGK